MDVFILQETEIVVDGERSIVSASDTFELAKSEAVQRALRIKGSNPIITWKQNGHADWTSNAVCGFVWDITKVEVGGTR